jgi:uncharacterized protein YggE
MKLPIAALALSLAALPSVALAQITPVDAPRLGEATMTVQGDGIVDRAPDQATVAVQIVTNDDNAAASVGKNNAIYNALKTKAGALGLAADAIRTTSYNVEFIPHPPKNLPPEQRQARYGYVTARSLSLSVTPLENVGKVVDAATAAGASNVGDVQFGLKDRRGAYLAALAAAMSDAKAQGTALAGAGGFSLVHVKSVNAAGLYMPAPLPMGAMMRAPAAAPVPPTEIQPGGPIEVNARVTVTYVIR